MSAAVAPIESQLTKVDIFWLQLQRVIAYLFFPFVYSIIVFLMRYCFGYKILELVKIRLAYAKLLQQSKDPILICANHLTKVDSLLLHWALGSIKSYIVHFASFAWNLPERQRYANNILLRIICYLGCCIPVDRGGSRDQVANSLNKLKYVLQHGGVAVVFPEGKRGSGDGIDIENYAYGVGQIITSVNNCRVLCVYLRGKKQKTKSSIPARSQDFYCRLQSIAPTSQQKGFRRMRELAQIVIMTLVKMEEEYFAYTW